MKNKGKLSVARIDPSLGVKTVRFSIHYVIHAYTHNSVISTYNTSIIFGIWDKKRENQIKNNELWWTESTVFGPPFGPRQIFGPLALELRFLLADSCARGTLLVSNRCGTQLDCSARREDRTSKVFKPSSGTVLAVVPTDGGLLFGESHD